jgi:hypothetical protein
MTEITLEGRRYLRNAEGGLTPIEAIKPQHLLEDQVVRKIVERQAPLREAVARFEADSREDIRALVDLLAGQYETKRGGAKGNVTLKTFDGLQEVQLAIGESLEFGPEIQAAKTLIDECLTDWAGSTGPELRAIVTDAFRVNKEGRLDKDRILALRRHDFADPRWKRAMEAISDSIRVARSKEYLRIYQRSAPGEKAEYLPIVGR